MSIIVPFYNAPINVFRQCLSSIQAQTYSDWECICIDDGSTDASPNVAVGYAEKDPRFRLIRQSNGGPGVARNTGLSAARGEYFTFVDADDALHPQMLECLLACAQKHAADITLCGNSEFRSDFTGGVIDVEKTVAASRCLFPPLLECLLDHRRHRVQPWGKLFLTDHYRELQFPGMYGPEDLYVLIDQYARARVVASVEAPLYHYRTDGGSLTRNGLKTYKTYITAAPVLAQHYESVCLAVGCSSATRLRLMRKVGASMVMLYLFEALTDAQLSQHEKKSCVEWARLALRTICDTGKDKWRSMPIKYWYLYPTFVKGHVPGVLGVSLFIRNAIRWARMTLNQRKP